MKRPLIYEGTDTYYPTCVSIATSHIANDYSARLEFNEHLPADVMEDMGRLTIHAPDLRDQLDRMQRWMATLLDGEFDGMDEADVRKVCEENCTITRKLLAEVNGEV